MNSIGTLFRLTSFGESHGPALGGVIDGMPAGIWIDTDFLRQEMARRRPGQSAIVSSRKETDEVQLLSGIFEGRTTGAPIGFVVYNTNQQSQDYADMRDVYRPSHADYTYDQKYGIRDHRGGGRSSARETVSRCVAGAFAKMALQHYGIRIQAYTSQIGLLQLDACEEVDLDLVEKNAVRCPHAMLAREMERYVGEVKAAGDSVGGVVTCLMQGVPVGLGEPVFHKLHADLSGAMMGINAAKGVEIGMGFVGAGLLGSQVLDSFAVSSGEICTKTNHSGGVQGGISNGEDIRMRVAFKPVATLLRDVETVNRKREAVVLRAKGRHDPCVVPRAVPIVEAMAAMVLLDHLLMHRSRAEFVHE